MAPEVWIPIALSFVMAIIAIVTLARNTRKDTSNEAEQRAAVAADLKYIRNSVDDIKLDNKDMKKEIGSLKEQIVRIDMRVESAHQRLDDMQKGKER